MTTISRHNVLIRSFLQDINAVLSYHDTNLCRFNGFILHFARTGRKQPDQTQRCQLYGMTNRHRELELEVGKELVFFRRCLYSPRHAVTLSVVLTYLFR